MTVYDEQWADRVLEHHNDDGKVPLDVLWHLLDDMAVISTRMRGWTCTTYSDMGAHDACPHHEATPEAA